jgi:hypothetical protein
VEVSGLAKDTYHHLKEDKKGKVLTILKRLFQEKPFQEVTVKEIVEELDIARGSFYQYFEDLEDAYFTVLDSEVTDIHMLFMHILHKKKGNLEATLLEYGEQLSKILFQKDTYAIYRNRYLYWNDSLNQKWKKNHQDQTQIFTQVKDNNSIELEKMFYLQGVIHALIKRNFQENWSKQEFLKKFKLHIYWVMKGVDNNGNG